MKASMKRAYRYRKDARGAGEGFGGRELEEQFLQGGRQHGEERLRFRVTPPVSVRGPMTEKIYRFSKESPEQAVDARDVASLLKTGLFRRV